MTLPSQVKKQVERTEQLIAALQAQQNPQDGTAAADGEGQVTPTDASAAGPQAEPQASPAPATPDSPAGSLQREYDALVTRHNVLQGKYNAEVPRLAGEKRALSESLENARQEVERLKARVAELERELDDKRQRQTDVDLQEVVETYGTGIVDTIERVAEKKARELVEPLQTVVNETEAERRERRERERELQLQSEFADAVTDLVPDWQEIDRLPAFHAYLAEVQPDSKTRQEQLLDALHAFDAAKAARIFLGFKRANPAKPSQSSRAALESQLTPDNATASPSPDVPRKGYTREEIRKFYQDKALGRIAPAEAERIEREIMAWSQTQRS